MVASVKFLSKNAVWCYLLECMRFLECFRVVEGVVNKRMWTNVGA